MRAVSLKQVRVYICFHRNDMLYRQCLPVSAFKRLCFLQTTLDTLLRRVPEAVNCVVVLLCKYTCFHRDDLINRQCLPVFAPFSVLFLLPTRPTGPLSQGPQTSLRTKNFVELRSNDVGTTAGKPWMFASQSPWQFFSRAHTSKYKNHNQRSTWSTCQHSSARV